MEIINVNDVTRALDLQREGIMNMTSELELQSKCANTRMISELELCLCRVSVLILDR